MSEVRDEMMKRILSGKRSFRLRLLAIKQSLMAP